MRFADKMRSREPVKRKDAFESHEVRILMIKLPRERTGNSIRIMLGTGIRSQELLALEPRHIAEDGSSIQILQAVNMVKGTAVIGQPKSTELCRFLLDYMRAQRLCEIQIRSTFGKLEKRRAL